MVSLSSNLDDVANQVRMYVDGVEVLSETTAASLSSNTDDIYIGSNWEGTKYWEGLLDDIRLYNRALTLQKYSRYI